MTKRIITCNSASGQRGVALAITLILLTVITLLSLSAMRSANLYTKIAVNHQHKQFSFQGAENALTRLITLDASEMGGLAVPGTLGAPATVNSDFFEEVGVAGSPDFSADLTMDMVEVSAPGAYKFSGFGLNVVTVVYQADAEGVVDGTKSGSHNRMEVALIRD
jgi:type IV pilus assembly protein PilX